MEQEWRNEENEGIVQFEPQQETDFLKNEYFVQWVSSPGLRIPCGKCSYGADFFEVTKNPKAPFIVYKQHFSTRVLVTSFDIRAYDQEREYDVAVVTGRVRVKTEAVIGKIRKFF